MDKEQGISKLVKIALILSVTTSLVLAPYALKLPSLFSVASEDANINPPYHYSKYPDYKLKITVEDQK